MKQVRGNNEARVRGGKSIRGNLIKGLILTLCFAFCLLLTACSDKSKQDLNVGVLLDVNGQQYAGGATAKIAAELAAEHINDYLKDMGHTKRIKLFVEDTQGDPQIAAEKIKNFKKDGIVPILCGSSAEIKAVSDYAKQNHHLLLSGLSTAPSLAEKNGNLFRFCLNDNRQAEALVNYAKETGTKSVVLMYRDDVYGNDLKTNIIKLALQAGIDIDQEVKYSPNETNFTGIVASAEQKVKQEKLENPNGKVAVLLISAKEVTGIFKAAAGNAELESVSWIGCDGVEPNAATFKETDTLGFAQKTGFTVCNFRVEESMMKGSYAGIPGKMRELTGLEKIPATAYYYYDAMWVLAQSWLTIAEIDYDLLKKSIPLVAESIRICTDDIGMDEFGDRIWGKYYYWQIKNDKFEKTAYITFGDWRDYGYIKWYKGSDIIDPVTKTASER